jgi:hypothetical protein
MSALDLEPTGRRNYLPAKGDIFWARADVTVSVRAATVQTIQELHLRL